MTTFRRIRFIGILILICSGPGCSPLEKIPIKKNYYDLVLPGESTPHKNLHTGSPLLVKEFRIAPAFDSHSFIYRIDRNKYINDYYNEFVSYPARLITEEFSDRLYATPYFSTVTLPRKSGIRYRLSGKINRLYGDFQQHDRPKAVMALQLILEKQSDRLFEIVQSRIYTATVKLSSRKRKDLVSGWRKGLDDIISRFVADFSRTVPHQASE